MFSSNYLRLGGKPDIVIIAGSRLGDIRSAWHAPRHRLVGGSVRIARCLESVPETQEK